MPLQRLHQAADILRSKGLPVVEVPNWKYTSRSDDKSVYADNRPTHFMHHHTASPITAHNTHDRCVRESLLLQTLEPNEPISNFSVCPHGCWFTVAAGPTNTNGVGRDDWHPVGHPLKVPDNSMNSYAMAVEILNNGIGEPYTNDCQAALVIGTAALCLAYNVGSYENRSHFEWAPTRKIDPAGPSQWTNLSDRNLRWNMNSFRVSIQEEMNRQINPGTGEEEMYIADLSGNLVVVGSSVRPVSLEELNGPLKNLPRIFVPVGSNWYAWLEAGRLEYTKRMGL